MPQDPFSPRDSGTLRLPPVAPGMNRISPPGSAQNFRKERLLDEVRGGTGAADANLLERARKHMEQAISAESENRAAALEDLKMKTGDQWDPNVVATRNIDKRPCLTVNKFPTFVHQITNDLRQNRPSICINPVGDKGDPEVAKLYRGLIRAIERDSVADIAYDTAVDGAVSKGFGYWRIVTEWENETSFNLVICIKRIRNSFCVYLDPTRQEPDGSDARWGFVTELMKREDFEQKYPHADPMPFAQAGMGETMKNWLTRDEIRIAEYFEIEYKPRELVRLDNGHVGWRDELDVLALRRHSIVDSRESAEPTVMWYKLTALEVIQRREWPGRWIPIVQVVGDEEDIEGKVKWAGVIRHAKGAQQMYNYGRTAEIEAVALAPKAPWVMEEGQIEGHEDEWKMANVQSMPYLLYKSVNLGGRPAPPPQRQQFAQVPVGIEAVIQGAAQDMLATTGIRFDATMNERLMDESGKAIRELRRTGDIGAFHYVDNLARSLRHTGMILLDLIPKIYSEPRMVTILRDDDKEELVRIDPNAEKPVGQIQDAGGKPVTVFNPTAGRYGVTVTIGPSYATKRIEASENMIQFARALPQTAMLIADLIAKNQDWPGADEIAARLAKTLPPQLLTPEPRDMSPQMQALLSGLDMQVKTLTQQLQQAMAALADKNADRALLADKAEKDFEAKLLKVVSDMETKMAAVEEKAAANVATHIRSLVDTVVKLEQGLATKSGGGGQNASA